jgi:hypothetical protein
MVSMKICNSPIASNQSLGALFIGLKPFLKLQKKATDDDTYSVTIDVSIPHLTAS